MYLPRANTGYIPEGFAGWPCWCPRDNVCSQVHVYPLNKYKTSTKMLTDTTQTLQMDSSPVSSKRHPGQMAAVSFLLACMWFSSFQINTQLVFFLTKWPFWMTENNFWSHFSPFQINNQCTTFFDFFSQNGPLAAILDDQKSRSIINFCC